MLSLGLTLFGILLAFVFYFRGKPRKQLCFQKFDYTIVDSDKSHLASGLKVLVNDVEAENVTASRVILWNEGNCTIDGANLQTKSPLRFEVKEGQILRVELEKVDRQANNVSIQADDKAAFVSFDYLDERDGFRVLILHSGKPDNVRLMGDIREIPSGPIEKRFAYVRGQRMFGFFVPLDENLLVKLFVFCISVYGSIFFAFRPELIVFFDSIGYPPAEEFKGDGTRTLFLSLVGAALAFLFWKDIQWRNVRKFRPELIEDMIKS